MGALVILVHVLTSHVTRRKSDACNSGIRDILDLGDVLDIVVGIANAPEDENAKWKGDEKHKPGCKVLTQVRSLLKSHS